MTSNLGATRPAPNFAIIEDELEAIHARLVKIPTHSEMLRLALGCLAALVVALIKRSKAVLQPWGDADTINLDGIACKRTARHWPCTDQS